MVKGPQLQVGSQPGSPGFMDEMVGASVLGSEPELRGKNIVITLGPDMYSGVNLVAGGQVEAYGQSQSVTGCFIWGLVDSPPHSP